jgi:hypothetical protein
MNEALQTVWIAIYESFRRRFRILAVTMVLLAFTAFFDGLGNHDRLAEEYQIAVDLILQEQSNAEFREEIKELYFEHLVAGPKEWEKLPGAIIIHLNEIEPLYRKYIRSLDAQNVRGTFNIGNQSLGPHAYTMALVYGPCVVLLAMIWQLLSIRKLHRRLYPMAIPDGAVQQKLNSLFFERVTARYGEGWRPHVFVSLGVIFIFAIGIPLIFAATRGMIQPDLSLAIDVQGTVFPRDDDPMHSRILTDEDSSAVFTALYAALFSTIAVVVLSVLALRTRCDAEEINLGSE